MVCSSISFHLQSSSHLPNQESGVVVMPASMTCGVTCGGIDGMWGWLEAGLADIAEKWPPRICTPW
jgi:hypothetical protein